MTLMDVVLTAVPVLHLVVACWAINDTESRLGDEWADVTHPVVMAQWIVWILGGAAPLCVTDPVLEGVLGVVLTVVCFVAHIHLFVTQVDQWAIIEDKDDEHDD